MNAMKKFLELIMNSKENYLSAKKDLSTFLVKNKVRLTVLNKVKIQKILSSVSVSDLKKYSSNEFEKGLNILDMADVSFFK